MVFQKNNKYKIFEQVLRGQVNNRVEEFRQYTLEIESKFDSDKTAYQNHIQKQLKGFPKRKFEK